MFDRVCLGRDFAENKQENCLSQDGHHIGKSGVLSPEQMIVNQGAGDAHKSHVDQSVAEEDRDEQTTGIIQKIDDSCAAFLFVLPKPLELDLGQSR